MSDAATLGVKKITFIVPKGAQISALSYDVFSVDPFGNPNSWNTKKDGTGVKVEAGQILEVNQNLNLYARYPAHNCTLQYVDISPEAKVVFVDMLSTIQLETSDVLGFKGWLENGKRLLNPDDVPSYTVMSDTTLLMSCYAWNTLTYDKNGAQSGMIDSTVKDCSKHAEVMPDGRLSVAIDAKNVKLEDNAFTYGYDAHWFNGWLVRYKDSVKSVKKQPGEYVVLSSDMVALADWVLSSVYVVNADVSPINGGEVIQSTSDKATDLVKHLTASPRTGYSFSNWSNGQTAKSIQIVFDPIAPAFEQAQCTSVKNITANFIDDPSYTVITYSSGSTTRKQITGQLNRSDITDASLDTTVVEVKLGNKVTSLGSRALADIQQLRTVVFSDPSTFSSIGDGAFSGDINLRSIDLSQTKTTLVPNDAFKSCASLKTISLNISTSAIGKRAFADCTGLQLVSNVGNVASIDDYAFDNCGWLAFAFKDALKLQRIGAYAFNKCEMMSTSNQIVPASLQSIGNNAFAGVQGMKFDMSSFSENSIIPTIGTNAFSLDSGCTIQFKNYSVSGVFAQNAQWNKYITIFRPQPYVSLTFNGNGGSGSQSSVQYLYGTNVTIPSCAFSRSKYKFTKWNTRADGKGTSYDAGAAITLTDNLILYAQWEEVKKVMVILETAMESAGGSLLAGCAAGPRNLYNCIKPSLDAAGLDAEYHLLCDSTKYSVSGITYESPTKTNILKLFEKSLNGDYAFSILFIADHGSGSACGAIGGMVSGTELANVIKKGDPNTKILFICDCCHAAGMAPFKAASMSTLSSDSVVDDVLATAISVDYDPHTDAVDNTIIDEMFKSLDDSSKEVDSKGLMAAAGSNTNPTILGWYTCESNRLGWMSSSGGMYFLQRICSTYSTNSTYAQHWSKIAASPYYYKYGSKGSDYYGYSYHSGSDVYEAHHIQYNYNGNFNTADKVFT